MRQLQRRRKPALLKRAALAGITLRIIPGTQALTVQGPGLFNTRRAKSGPTPAICVILVSGKRVRSFLSRTRAERKIRELLGEPE